MGRKGKTARLKRKPAPKFLAYSQKRATLDSETIIWTTLTPELLILNACST
jgi:hypothetical protein